MKLVIPTPFNVELSSKYLDLPLKNWKIHINVAELSNEAELIKGKHRPGR